jgi:hypothetical protein
MRHRGARDCAVLSSLPRNAAFHLPSLQTQTASWRHVRSVRRGLHEVHHRCGQCKERSGGFSSRPHGAAVKPTEKCSADSVQYGHFPATTAFRRVKPQRLKITPEPYQFLVLHLSQLKSAISKVLPREFLIRQARPLLSLRLRVVCLKVTRGRNTPVGENSAPTTSSLPGANGKVS